VVLAQNLLTLYRLRNLANPAVETS
jgi:hypothetical protein